MFSYAIKRILTLFPTLLIASVLVFLFIHLIPGNPAAVMLGDIATPEEVAILSAELGLNKPLPTQFAIWFTNVLSGDLGTSIFFREPVTSVVADGAETSVFLAVMTMFWIVVVGVPIGIASASWHGSWIDQLFSGGAMFAASIPTFWLGLYLILVFSVGLGWLPSSGFPSVLDDGGLTNLRYLILPSITLAAPNAALIIRLIRGSMLDVQREDHVRTARAKGLHPIRVAVKHVFRNAFDCCSSCFWIHFRGSDF